MDKRELETRLKALQKAVAEKESPSTLISILETLKNEVVPTEELLRVRSWEGAILTIICAMPARSCSNNG
jgi:hypothetical protein